VRLRMSALGQKRSFRGKLMLMRSKYLNRYKSQAGSTCPSPRRARGTAQLRPGRFAGPFLLSATLLRSFCPSHREPFYGSERLLFSEAVLPLSPSVTLSPAALHRCRAFLWLFARLLCGGILSASDTILTVAGTSAGTNGSIAGRNWDITLGTGLAAGREAIIQRAEQTSRAKFLSRRISTAGR
jgi:hypothetical protein